MLSHHYSSQDFAQRPTHPASDSSPGPSMSSSKARRVWDGHTWDTPLHVGPAAERRQDAPIHIAQDRRLQGFGQPLTLPTRLRSQQ